MKLKKLIRHLALYILIVNGLAVYGLAQRDSVLYQYQFKDANGTILLQGESFDNKVRNGQWRTYNQYNQLLCIEIYRNDTLNGPASLFFHHNPNSPTKLVGHYSSGKMAGEWNLYQADGKATREGIANWIHMVRFLYDSQGNLRTRFQLYPNGLVALELHMSIEGRDSYYRQFSIRGKQIGEGVHLPDLIELAH